MNVVTYLVAAVEGVLGEAQDQRGLANGLVPQEDDLVLHMHRVRFSPRSLCHFQFNFII